jgi:hypothetical protein
MVGRLDMPLAFERLIPAEEVGGAVPPALVILPGRHAWSWWLRLPHMGTQLDRTLIEADPG